MTLFTGSRLSAVSITGGCKLPGVKRTRLAVCQLIHVVSKSELLADKDLPAQPQSMIMSAVRFIAGKHAKGRLAPGTIQLLCHVKPGASANREGITAVTDEIIDVCVAAQAREGEANAAVRTVIAKTLRVPKSDVEIAKGMKSREKTVAIQIGANVAAAEEIERIRALLSSSIVQ
jgi:uncharacterized protein